MFGRQLLRLSSVLVLCAFSGFAQRPSEIYNGRSVAEARVIVKLRSPSANTIALFQQLLDADSVRQIGGASGPHLFHSRSRAVTALVTAVLARSEALYVEPDYILRTTVNPNDPSLPSQWGLKNSPPSGISAVSAWGVSSGSTQNVVGVVDTGIDYNHPDLAANVWSAPTSFTVSLSFGNLTCPAGSHGYNAILRSCDPMDDHGHGTHVAGIIGAVGNNSIGVVGVNWTTSLMGLKFMDATGSGYTSDAVDAIEFALQARNTFAGAANVRVLSNSWGGSSSQLLLDEINKTNTNNILFVAAAGNSGSNNDTTAFYPASYNVPNLISVAATDSNDQLAGFSNYGSNSVHLGAPGVNILSTLRSSSYGSLSGTSMATPFVSGAAALVLSSCNLSTAGVKSALLNNVDLISSLTGKTITGGRLNVDRAIRSCAALAPPLTVSCATATAQVGQSYSSMFVGSGGVTPYSFSLGSGALPSGLNVSNSTGAVTGAPTVTGTFNYRAQIVDSLNTIATATCSMTVNAATQSGPLLGAPPTAPNNPNPPNVSPASATWYDTSIRSNVRTLYNSIFVPSRAVSLGWAGDVASGNWGDTSQAYKDAVTTRLNWLRGMAGVPAAVTLNSVFNGKDQQAAMMMSANRALNHTPPTSWTNYTAQGAEAAGSSNLCLGFINDPGCLELYMQDFGSGNNAAGHRRWILYPQTLQYGTGDVPSTTVGSYPSANALWVFDGNYGGTRPATRDNFVAWPSKGYFPYQLEPIRWSFAYPGATFSGATVTMTRGGVAVPVTIETVANGYGENTIVWYPTSQNPNNPPSPVPPSSDTTVAITVSNVMIGGSPQSFSYNVIIFDPATVGSGPVVVSQSPQSGTGAGQIFTFNFNDTDGYTSLNVLNVLVNTALDGRFGCYIAYVQPANTLYLMNDAGDTLIQPGLVLNGSGSTSNSYCTINGAGSSAVGSGAGFTLNLSMSFNSPAFSGDKIFYLAARDTGAGNSGWQLGGVWRVPFTTSPLTVSSLTPNAGSGLTQTFTAVFHDPIDGNNITHAQILINSALIGDSACYVGYVRAGNLLYLVDDVSPGLLGPVVPNSGSGSMQNSQCSVNGVGTTSAVSGTDLTLTVNVTFKPIFVGPKIVYAAAQTSTPGNTGWQSRGFWKVQ